MKHFADLLLNKNNSKSNDQVPFIQRRRGIEIKSSREIYLMKNSSRIVGTVLREINDLIKPGMSTKDLDDFAEKRIRDALISKDLFFAASMPLYPDCEDVGMFRNPQPTKETKTWMILGGSDNYTRAEPCVELGKKIKANGGDIIVDVKKGWYHDFIGNYEVEDTAIVNFTFRSGTLCTLSVSDTIVAPYSYELTAGENPAYPITNQSAYFIGGTKGSIQFPNLKHWYNRGERSWWKPIYHKDFNIRLSRFTLINQIDHLCDVVSGKAKPKVSGNDGLQSLKIFDAILRSTKTGKKIRVN